MESPKQFILFHTNEDKWNSIYHALFNAPTSRHIDIEIKQYHSSHGFPAFFYYTEEIVMLLTKMMEEQAKLIAITDTLPNIALQHFTKSCLIEEIQSTNDIEGVHSTRKEMNTAIDEQLNIENKNNTRLWGIVNKYLKLQNKENIPFSTSQDLRIFYDDFILDEVYREDAGDKPDGAIFRKGSVDVTSNSKIIHRGGISRRKNHRLYE